MDASVQLSILEFRARQAVVSLGSRIQQGVPWKDLNMDCANVTRAHIEVFALQTFLSHISATGDAALKRILNKLCTLVYQPPVIIK